MRRRLLRLVAGVVIGLVPVIAQARILHLLDPDELVAKSPIVCNGLVTQVTQIGKTAPSSAPYQSSVKWLAHIKVLAVTKGQLPTEINLYYTTRFFPLDGPVTFTLHEGRRYRFFLRPNSTGSGYNDVLEDEIDDLWAVQSLTSKERDDSPPLLKDEARNLALAWATRCLPSIQIPDSDLRVARYMDMGDDDRNVWRVQIFFQPKPHLGEPDGEAFVLGDRTIDASSWIAAGPARKSRIISAKDVGSRLWIDRDSGNPYEVVGTIRQITRYDIIVAMPNNLGLPQTATVDKDSIKSIRPLVPVPGG